MPIQIHADAFDKVHWRGRGLVYKAKPGSVAEQMFEFM